MKPFIYGLAFQDGIAAPDSMQADLPRQFGAYAPENFDRGFSGMPTAAEALRRSLNVPAVALLERVGPARFVAGLRAVGCQVALPRAGDASLPVALGGLGITPRDLAALYAALAGDGRFRPLRLSPRGDSDASASVLLEPRAAGQVADILTFPLPGAGDRGVAWKTGTSWGGRDAWAVGFDLRHVVLVWIGRPDGTALPAATGLGMAAPMLGRVFDLLPAHPRAPGERAGGPRIHGVEAPVADALRLLFPPNGAVLSADGPVTIRAMGGRRPLTFMVDGRPLSSEPARRDVGWTPDATGFYRLTVLDADGVAAHARIRVR